MPDTQELRNSISARVRDFFETGKNVSFTPEEMQIFKKEFGATYLAYERAINILNNKQIGGIDNER